MTAGQDDSGLGARSIGVDNSGSGTQEGKLNWLLARDPAIRFLFLNNFFSAHCL
ncbi:MULTISPECIES: hypothetical protein [Rhodobacterales]|uniref:hypothetical protein n=1 Tax=Rhodobacterales TaxID=204455 RepID=UPI000B20474A|nr:hypothetical protein [Phaeobacter sp. CECT 5382]